MKKHLYYIMLAGFSFNLLCYASTVQKNLITNGDFEADSSGWRGDENIEFETAAKTNKICRIAVNKEGNIEFSQEFNTLKIADLTIRFKVNKSADYEGEGFEIMFTRSSGGGSGRPLKVPKNNEWTVMELRMDKVVQGAKRIKVSFVVKPGQSGSLSFDDIEIVESVKTVKSAAPSENISEVDTDEYRIFTDENGREIEAKIVRTVSNGQTVVIERKGLKKTISVPVTAFNDETQAYIKCWSQNSDFLNDRMLFIETRRNKEIVEDRSTTQESSTYTLTQKIIYYGYWMDLIIKNKSSQPFSDVSVEYTLYYNRDVKNKSTPSQGTLYKDQMIMNLDPKSEQEIQTEQIVLLTHTYSGGIGDESGGVEGELEGVIIHLTLKLETGDTMKREIIYPENLKYSWTTKTQNLSSNR